MPIVTPDEPYARPPNTLEPDVHAERDGRIDVQDGVGVVQGARIAEALSLDECRARGRPIGGHSPNTRLDARHLAHHHQRKMLKSRL